MHDGESMAEGNPGLTVRLATSEELTQVVSDVGASVKEVVYQEVSKVLQELGDNAFKDETISKLNSELAAHRDGLVRKGILRPIVDNLITMAGRVRVKHNMLALKHHETSPHTAHGAEVQRVYAGFARSLGVLEDEVINVLGEMGVERIPTDSYDPKLHKKIAVATTQAEQSAGEVVLVSRRGFRWKDGEVIEKAEVKVREFRGAQLQTANPA